MIEDGQVCVIKMSINWKDARAFIAANELRLEAPGFRAGWFKSCFRDADVKYGLVKSYRCISRVL